MREIKFRGWDEKNKEMVDNINLLFANSLNDCFEEYKECGLQIMQYTGLKDKYGVEIYEGDIVRTAKGVTQVIAWADYYSAFVAEIPGGDRPYLIDTSDEIIGNIHEGEV